MTSKYLSPADVVTNKFAVRATYRYLLRATGLAFQNDTPTLLAARTQARLSFRTAATLESGGTEAAQAVEHAQGVAKILREHVVQGKQVGGAGSEKYKLRIHEETQRLDNDQTKLGKGTVKSFREIKDAQF